MLRRHVFKRNAIAKPKIKASLNTTKFGFFFRIWEPFSTITDARIELRQICSNKSELLLSLRTRNRINIERNKEINIRETFSSDVSLQGVCTLTTLQSQEKLARNSVVRVQL
jgi:hypothetical protein